MDTTANAEVNAESRALIETSILALSEFMPNAETKGYVRKIVEAAYSLGRQDGAIESVSNTIAAWKR